MTLHINNQLKISASIVFIARFLSWQGGILDRCVPFAGDYSTEDTIDIVLEASRDGGEQRVGLQLHLASNLKVQGSLPSCSSHSF